MRKLRNWLIKRRRRESDVEVLSSSLKASDTHIIALARLGFIKPRDLVREAFNSKANAEYLLKMIEAREKLLKGGVK